MKDKDKKRIFLTACSKGDYYTANIFLNMFDEYTIKTESNYALKVAVRNGHIKIVELLLNYLTIEEARADDNYAFKCAIIKGRFDIAQLLIDFDWNLAEHPSNFIGLRPFPPK